MSDLQQRPPSFWEGLMTGGYAAGNELLFGLPDFLVGKIGGDAASERLRAMRERNATANLVGTGAGLVGGMFIPGGAIAKGAGAALRGAGQAVRGAGALSRGLRGAGTVLTNAGRFAAGTGGRLGSAIGRGAIQAAEQAIPRALIEGADTGDWGTAGLNAAAGVGLGGALGGAFHGLSRGARGLMRKAGEVGKDLTGKSGRALAGELGVSGRLLRQDLTRNLPGGLRRSNQLGAKLNESVDEIIKAGQKYDLMPEATRGDRIASALDSAGLEYQRKMSEALLANPKLGQEAVDTVARLVQEGDYAPEAIQGVQSILSKYDTGTADGLRRMRDAVTDQIKKLRSTPGRTEVGTDKLEAFQAVQSMLDDRLNEAGGQAMRELGKEYRALKNLQMGDLMDDLADANLPNLGSNTQTKQGVERLVKGLIGGGSLGGASVLADVARGEDVDIGRAALASLGGTVGGAVAGKALQGLARKGLASAHGVLTKADPLFERLIAQGAPEAAGAAGQIAGRVAPGLNIPGGAGALSAVGTGSTAPIAQPGAVPADQALEPGQAQEVGQDTQEVLESAGPEDFSPELRAKIEGRMADIYASEFAAIMGPEEFRERIMALTNGLTDKASLGFLLYDTPAEAEAYGQRLALAQRMGSIDMGSALRKGGIMDLFTNEDEITGQNRSQLENLMLEIRSKGDIGATTKADRDEIARDIKEMQDNPDIIPVKMAQYGLDFNDLRELGVI